MQENLNDLRAFLLVAQTGSFTKAAAQIGVSQSALSHTIRGLEERLKIKLFHRTTRSISTTEAGEQLYQRLSPLFDDIDKEINELSAFQNTIKGNLRINATEFVFSYLVWDKLQQFMHQYPEVNLELVAETRFTNIVAERFDAGIRLGGDVEKDMIAVKVADELRICTVASPAYLAQYGTPQTPDELTKHRCLHLRLPTSGGLLDWEFKHPQTEEIIKMKLSSYFISNNNNLLRKAVLSDLGIAWIPYEIVKEDIVAGRLVSLLADWNMHYQGIYLYYPNRHGNSTLFKALVKALKQ